MAPPPPTVEVVDVVQKDVPIYTEWVATTDGLVNATIRAEVQGYLLKQNYREGDSVKKGQLLFEIDPRPFQAALNQAQAAQKQAEAALNQVKAEVTRNEAQYYIADTNLKRVKPLAEEHAISQKDLDDAVGMERSARAAVVESKASVGVAEAAIASAKAATAKAELDFDFTKIMSPIDGIAGIARAQVGDLVGPSQGGELATVSTVDPIKVYFNTSEQAYIAHMSRFAADPAALEHEKEVKHELILADGSRYPHNGTFYAVDRQVDVRTGTIRVEVLFPNPDNLLRPGQFAKIHAMESKLGALLVPQRAVTDIQGASQVAVVGAGNKVEMRPVKTGERIGTLWIIDEGVKTGEQIVAEGTQKVKQGMIVVPKPVVPETESASAETGEHAPASTARE